MHRACLQPNSVYEAEPHHEGAVEYVTVMKGKFRFKLDKKYMY